jgi:methylation protein EvaC
MDIANNCRVCNNKIEPFMTFGNMPIANGFLKKEAFKDEYFFEMKPSFCNKCFAFQLIEQPDAELMFNGSYPFFSSLSKHMQTHFDNFANSVINRFLKSKDSPMAIELGSNDGIMLRHFKNAGIKHLGIEPSQNVAQIAKEKGINTISEFFNEELAVKVLEEYGHADVMFAANVMCHIPNINSVFAGISNLLSKDGVLIFEDPYLGDMLNKVSYDQIYDEHVYIFSALSVISICERHDLELIDVEPQVTHGGSMRYFIGKKGSHEISNNVLKIIMNEEKNGFKEISTYERFRDNCEKSKKELLALLTKIKAENKRVVGYGATSKSTTVLNYSEIGPDLIDFISDTTPLKQNKFSPGAHIPVKSYENFSQNPPDYALLFAWNHKKEIFEKETEFEKNGGKWITFVPRVEIL